MQTAEQTTTAQVERRSETRTVEKALAGTYSVEAFAGIAVVTLAILALANVLPLWLTGGAVIAAGIAFLMEGAGIAARARQWQRSLGADRYETAAMGGGLSTQILAGAAGVTLGILALVGISANVLLSVAVIVFGGALFLGTTATYEAAKIEAGRGEEGSFGYQAVQAANGARILVGAGAAALGILGLLEVGPALVLTQVAMLAVGAILLLGGSALGARFGVALAEH